MNKNGPIVIIDDDPDDLDIFASAYNDLDYNNDLVCFSNGQDALDYLSRKDVKPFVVISDINMPGMDGFRLKSTIEEDPYLRDKCTPFLFMTTSSAPCDVNHAYQHRIQGFFIKPNSLHVLKRKMNAILDYWTECTIPSVVC